MRSAMVKSWLMNLAMMILLGMHRRSNDTLGYFDPSVFFSKF